MKQNCPTKAKSTNGNASVSETVETFSFGPSRLYADASEYAANGLTFDILTIAFETGRGYEGQDRWAIGVKPADRDCEILSLGSNPGRDEQLKAAQAHLARGGTIKNVRLRRSGSAYYFTDGDR